MKKPVIAVMRAVVLISVFCMKKDKGQNKTMHKPLNSLNKPVTAVILHTVVIILVHHMAMVKE